MFVDNDVTAGSWLYRIVDCDVAGKKSALCQKLVEVESSSEQTQTLVVGAVIASLALAFFVIGSLIDPIQTTNSGGSFF